MSRRSGLGRGLSALIPQATSDPGAEGGADGPILTEIAVGDISPNPNQPRVHFDEESLADLAASIAQIGILQPILVRRTDDGYQLIAGERRWRAAKRAGLTAVPAVVRTTSDDVGTIEEALIENLHRQDLTALEEAAAYLQLIEDFQLTHDDVARRVGKSRSAITNTLRLLGLPPEVQRLLADGKLSAGHARALLGTPDRQLQERLAAQIVAEGWSVRATEELVRNGGVLPPVADAGVPAAEPSAGPSPTPLDGAGLTPATRLRPPGLLELEELLAERLDTRVGVQMGSKRGKVTIEFADLEDLERIYRVIVGDR
jgi:ParB family chromosome partitioning protein